MYANEIEDLVTEADWEAANALSDEDYSLIMETDQKLRLNQGSQVDWNWMSLGYED